LPKQHKPSKPKKEPKNKQVILVTGTPCVGKTSLAQRLADELDGRYVNLTELAKTEKLALRKDTKRNTIMVNEEKMRNKLQQIIKNTEKPAVIIDGHYAAAVVPKEETTMVLVLRRDPRQLREFMTNCGFAENKLQENLESEVLDVCLIEALQEQDQSKVCELNVTDKTVETSLTEALAVLKDSNKCRFGNVDWISTLEQAGVLNEYLKS